MIAVLRTIVIRLALCGLVTWIAYRQAGLTSAVSTVVLYAIALAKPLLDLASELRHLYRRAHWRDREGRHYVFRRIALSVHEDTDHRRWIGLAGVRAIVGFTASDATLRITYPDGFRLIGRPPEPHLSDEALIAHLKKERSPIALKFRHWAEREIAFPARRLRERYGIRPEAAPREDGAFDADPNGSDASANRRVAARHDRPGSAPAPLNGIATPSAPSSVSAPGRPGSAPPAPSSKSRR